MPVLGDRVTIGKSDSVWTVSMISPNGKEVGLEIPSTEAAQTIDAIQEKLENSRVLTVGMVSLHSVAHH
jgi:hypothetical protein